MGHPPGASQTTPKQEIDLALKRRKGRIMKKKNIGSTFDSWLRAEGLYEKVSATAIKRVVARQVAAAMQKKSPKGRDTRRGSIGYCDE